MARRLKAIARRRDAHGEIADAMALLDTLLAVGPTVERESLYGSAYKRLAMIEAAAKQHATRRSRRSRR